MLSDISLNLYKSFIEVYKTGSISKASKRLFISQPAVSINIKALEKSMDCILFIKKNNMLVPSDKAHILYNYLTNVFQQLELAEEEIYSNNIKNKGIIKIGCQTHIFSAILSKKIAQFNKIYPNIQFEILSRSTVDMIKQLAKCDLDLILDTSPINRPSNNIEIKSFIEVENVFFAKSNSKFPDNIKTNELSNYPLILPILYSKTIDALKQKIGDIELNPVINSWTTETIVSLVKQEMGIGYVMKNYIEDDVKNNIFKIVNLDKELPKTEINVCYNKKNLSNINKLFLNFIIGKL